MKRSRTGIFGLLSLSLVLPGVAFAETYEYDAAGRVTRVVYDDGSGLIYTYDANGNRLSRDAVTDAVRPVITLLGDASVSVEQSASYVDAGATASDNLDGDLTASIVVGGTFVDTATIGSFTITYDVTDAAGNAALQVVRTVMVTDPGGNPDPDPSGGGGCGCDVQEGSQLSSALALVGVLWWRRRRRR